MLVRRCILLFAALAAVLAGGAAAAHRSAPAPSGTTWGVTLDNDGGIAKRKLAAQVDALAALPYRPTARVVIDYGATVADYADAIPAIHGVSNVVAQLGDSSELKRVSTATYARWAKKFVDAYKGQVDMWEIGNEVNGEWVGTPAQEVARIQAASDVVRAAGGKTMLTLYYNPNCWDKAANEMFTWLGNNTVPQSDLVTISYYPSDCNDYWPTAATWQGVFDRLHARFPGATLQFGEAGQSANSLTADQNVALLTRYTAVHIAGDNFTGGYYWWYWAENAVPKGGPFWLGYAALMQ
jgi:hypothetical protein